MGSYDDVRIKNIFNSIYKIYKSDIFNPFNANQTNDKERRLSDKFSNKLNSLITFF